MSKKSANVKTAQGPGEKGNTSHCQATSSNEADSGVNPPSGSLAPTKVESGSVIPPTVETAITLLRGDPNSTSSTQVCIKVLSYFHMNP